MNIIAFLVIFGMALSTTVFAQPVENQIPKGRSNYTLKNTKGVDRLINQWKDMGLTHAEVDKLTKMSRTSLKNGTTVLTLDNKPPYITLRFQGLIIKMKHKELVPYTFYDREGMGNCSITEISIKCRNILENGYVSNLELIFTGNELALTKITEHNTVKVELIRIELNVKKP